VIAAYLDGWRRVLAAPWIAGGVLVATIAAAVPLASLVARSVETHLGSSLEAERAAAGWHGPWAAEFGAQAQGVERTLTHEILGFGATLAIVSGLADQRALHPAVAWSVGGYLLLWTFLAGGILDRLARGRPVRAAAFFSACGVYFLRFFRLALLVGPAYWALFRWLHPWLFVTLYNRWTRDMTEERGAALLRAALYLLFFACVTVVAVLSDYAKIRAVVEDRHSMIGAVAAAVRFVRRRWTRVVGLYALNAAGVVVVLGLWFVAAPSATAPVWLAFLLGQIYLLLRLWTKLVFLASGAAFFQSELAHAQYTAAPLPVWPESPAAEAIR
jgi:hypothetical protein